MTTLIYLNGRFLTQPPAGVQRYARELFNQFDALLADQARFSNVTLVCLAPPEPIDTPPWKHIPIKQIGVNRGSLWEQVDLPRHLNGQMLFSPANIGPWNYRNQIVTFHDASIYAVPEAYSALFRLKYRFVFHQLVNKVRRIITDSVFSQRELARYLHKPAHRFDVVPLAADHFKDITPDEKILHTHKLDSSPYLLLVSSISRHKNFARVIEALQLSGCNTRLVIAGNNYNNVFKNVDTSSSTTLNATWLGRVNDQELKALYEHAQGFIYPSIYEGFGLPPLEAMQCGCPVLCSNAASLPEVVGDAALLFDPYDIGQMANIITQFIDNPSVGQVLRAKGDERCAQFSWRKTAEATLAILLNPGN